MRALTVVPLKPGNEQLEDVPEPSSAEGSIVCDTIAVGVEDRAPGDEDVGARSDGLRSRLGADAAVDLEVNGDAQPADGFASGRQLGEHLGQEALAAEPGMHAHHEQQVDRAEVGLDGIERRLGVQDEPGPDAERSHRRDQRCRIAQLDVDAADLRAGLGERPQHPSRIIDHQVAVEDEIGVSAQ